MILNARQYGVKRLAKAFVDGVLTETVTDDLTVLGNLQPVSDSELSGMPEGFRRRTGRKFKLYTDPSVVLSIDPPDRVAALSTTLFVHGVIEWPQGLIPHRKWLLVEPETEAGK